MKCPFLKITKILITNSIQYETKTITQSFEQCLEETCPYYLTRTYPTPCAKVNIETQKDKTLC